MGKENPHMDIYGGLNLMSRKRKCVKCNNIRVCRYHSDGCFHNRQKLCKRCNNEMANIWWENNKEYKKEYMKNYRKGKKDIDVTSLQWLDFVKNNYNKMDKKEKLTALFLTLAEYVK